MGGRGAERLYTSLVKVFFSVATMFLFFFVSHSVFEFPLDMTVVCVHYCGAISLLLLPKLADMILRN